MKKYNPSLDIARIVAILAVVLIHTTTRSLEATHYDLVNMPFTLFLNQASRFAVPLFFMVSGFALELNYHALSYLDYLKKRASRILVPYLFWSLIYYFFVYTKHGSDFIYAFLTGSASYQLYFIPSLFVLYLIFPLLHKIYSFLSNKWVFILLGIVEVFLLFNDYKTHEFPFSYPVSVAFFNYFVFILGMVASRNQDWLAKIVEKLKFILMISAPLMAFYVFFEGRSKYLSTYNYNDFYSQWRPSVLIYTILVGSIIFLFGLKRNIPLRIIKTFSGLSFFVFFIHVVILEVVWQNIGIYVFQKGSLWFDPLFFLTVAVLSFLIASIVHKIELVRRLTG